MHQVSGGICKLSSDAAADVYASHHKAEQYVFGAIAAAVAVALLLLENSVANCCNQERIKCTGHTCASNFLSIRVKLLCVERT